jgi:hypothetical protein
MKALSSPPRPRLVTPAPLRPQLGDMLQRLALISPTDLHHIARLVADVLRHAEQQHKGFFPDRPANLS